MLWQLLALSSSDYLITRLFFFVCFVLWMELLGYMRTSCTTSGFSFTMGKDVKKDLEEQTKSIL